MNNQQRIEKIREYLQKALQPNSLDVIDESHLHAGHAGAKTGMGHFAIIISADAFLTKSRIEQHRMIYDALGNLMQTDIHALRITINAPK